MGSEFRGLKIAVAVMCVLILVGTTGLVVGVLRKANAPAARHSSASFRRRAWELSRA